MRLGDVRRGKISNNVIGFARALRRAGLPIDTARIALAQEACVLVGLSQREDLRSALKSVLANRQQDLHVFDEIFDAFFRNPESVRQLMAQLLPQTKVGHLPRRSPRASEALVAAQPASQPPVPREDTFRLDAAMSASAVDRLRHADFESLSASEFQLVEQLARRVPLSLPYLASRRLRCGERGHRVHWPRLMRDCARHGGDLGVMSYLRPVSRPLPLLILVDVSGSMERYARLMLAFLHQATRAAPRSVFSFGVTLTDLTQSFRKRDTDQMFDSANVLIKDFASGTRLGESLAILHCDYPQVLVARRTVVLLITDGLDTGIPKILERELSWLAGQSRYLLWLNPLLRYAGYQPSAVGAQVLAAHAHRTLAIHNLAKVEELALAMVSLMRL